MSLIVYALVDPRNDSTRYIGLTENVIDRFIQHLRCRDKNARKNDWIEELQTLSLVPIMRTLEVGILTKELGVKREMYWMQHYRYLGVDLLNAAMPAVELQPEDFMQPPDDSPKKLIGITIPEAARLPIVKRRGLKAADVRKAIKSNLIPLKSDGSIAKSAVENWAKTVEKVTA